MITIRKSADRGRFDFGWLDTRHTFSFGDYHDPEYMGFRSLRVINEDRIAPGAGFPEHPHRDMEILSYPISGGLAHRDSMGNAAVVGTGEIQRMSAGSGVRHSEFNASKTEPAHFLQIWLLPGQRGIEPGYEQKSLPNSRGRLALIASPDGQDDAVRIHQDVRLYAATLGPGNSVSLDLAPGRHAWVQVVRGTGSLNGQALAQGDGAAMSDEKRLTLTAAEDAEFLVFDLA